RTIAGIDEGDLKRITTLKDIVTAHVDEYVGTFFDYLSRLEEARPLTSNKAIAERSRRLQTEQLMSMVQGDYGLAYVAQRLELGLLYSRAGLDLHVFLGAFHHLLRSLGSAVINRYDKSANDAFQNFMALKKVAFMDLGIIVDVL